MLRNILDGQVVQCSIEIFCFFENVAGVCECLCNDGVDDNGGVGYGVSGTNHTELKFIIGKRKG